MRKLLTAIVVLPIAALLILFALANRAPAVLSLDPFSPGATGWSIQLPLFLVILISLMAGVVTGGVAGWFSQAPQRREARHNRHEVRRLEQEAADLRRAVHVPQAPQPSAASVPALEDHRV